MWDIRGVLRRGIMTLEKLAATNADLGLMSSGGETVDAMGEMIIANVQDV